ncbi:MAG: hypothetical protein AB8I08_35465 [Sandaracinaceae bacterium]
MKRDVGLNRPVALMALVLLFGCEPTSLLTVELSTGLVAGREFVSVETTLSVDPPGTNPAVLQRVDRPVEIGDDFVDGGRIAAFEGIMPGRYFARAVLRSEDGSILVAQVREVEVTDTTIVTIPITRDCIGVECPGSGPPGNLACLAGSCVDPRCSPETTEFCPPLDCEADTDCTPPGIACADVSCVAGTCFVYSGGAACPAQTWCDPDLGCVPEDPSTMGSGCEQIFCDVGNECEVGLLACDGTEVCELAANAFPGSACSRGECDGSGECVGLPLELTVEGTGTVVSEPARLACESGTCTERFDRDSMVTLRALAGEGYELEGWTGDCDSVELDRCVVEMSEARSVTAQFRSRAYVVQVTYSGSGTGSVTVATTGETDEACDAPGCSVQRPHGASVTLTATATGGSTFSGWGGDCASEAGTTCVLDSIESAVDVGVSFATEPDLLRVIQSGDGTGSVVSTPAGIDCGSVCASPFTGEVTLEASPDFGSEFMGWSGDAAACGTSLMCTVTVSGSVTVEAQWARGRYNLTVDPNGGVGTGTITSMPSGIDCPGTCSAAFDGGDTVTLVAVPDDNMQVVGWTGDASCGAAPTCEVPLGAPASVGVIFERVPVTLTVARDGAGGGRIDSDPVGIGCGSTCSVEVPHGTSLSLTATADLGSEFTGWTGGGCGSANPCDVALSADTSVRATFAVSRHDLTAMVGGDGSGLIQTDLFTCAGGPCTQEYEYGDMVSLYADVTMGNFAGWGGACASFGTEETCQLEITGDVMVTAAFTLSNYTLTAGQSGDGTGTIRSDQGIDCVGGMGTCTLSLLEGTADQLVAVPAEGSRFVGWSGACTGTGACDVRVNGPTVVTALFQRIRYKLTVELVGKARVTTSGREIDCPAHCANDFPEGTVTLYAEIESGMVGTWSEPSCGTDRECRVVLGRDLTVTYTVTKAEAKLKVDVGGTGEGIVTSEEPRFECRSGEEGCELVGSAGQVVTLVATADEGSVFEKWDGATGCGTRTTCEVTLAELDSVKAIFSRASGTLCRLIVELSGGLEVVSGPAGISCPGVCASEFKCEFPVILRPSEPASWSGCDPSPDGAACEVRFSSSTIVVEARAR